jgi:hypothetical protein
MLEFEKIDRLTYMLHVCYLCIEIAKSVWPGKENASIYFINLKGWEKMFQLEKFLLHTPFLPLTPLIFFFIYRSQQQQTRKKKIYIIVTWNLFTKKK